MDRHRIIWVAGMSRSGSMWLLNIARDLIRSAGKALYPEQVLPYDDHHNYLDIIKQMDRVSPPG